MAVLHPAVRRRAVALLPRVRGTECARCGYAVPALGLPPDAELAWFESFEGGPCPSCCGMAVGVLAGVAIVLLHGAMTRAPSR